MTAPAAPLLSGVPVGYWTDGAGAWCTLPWPADPAARQALADHSLGPLVIRWAEGRLTPDGYEQFGPGLIHPLTGQPWQFTRGQKRFLLMWYWYDERGRYRYRSGVKRGSKGTGKDYIAAAHGNIELVGPSQLVWDGGAWAGMQHRMPLVQIASNSEAQSKDTLRVARRDVVPARAGLARVGLRRDPHHPEGAGPVQGGDIQRGVQRGQTRQRSSS